MGQFSLYLGVSLASSYSASCASAALCVFVLFLVYLQALINFLSLSRGVQRTFCGWVDS